MLSKQQISEIYQRQARIYDLTLKLCRLIGLRIEAYHWNKILEPSNIKAIDMEKFFLPCFY